MTTWGIGFGGRKEEKDVLLVKVQERCSALRAKS